jgi:amino acid transporter
MMRCCRSAAVACGLTDDNEATEKMSFGALFFLAFLWACGGPYGTEGIMQLGPSGFVFSTFVASMVLYAVPLGLMNAELATAIPKDGGLVVWVAEAFGPTIGRHNTWWYSMSIVLDCSIYPLMAAKYITAAAGYSRDTHEDFMLIYLGIAESIVVLVTLMKLCGSGVVVKFAAIGTVASLVPAAIMVVVGSITIPMRPERWLRFTNVSAAVPQSAVDEFSTQWTLLISWCIWLSSGFLGLGSLAAGVASPKRTFTMLLLVLVPVVMLVYVSPLLIALNVSEDLTLYTAGYFTDVARVAAGEWLAQVFTVSAIWSTIALYSTVAIMAEISVQVLAEDLLPRVKRLAGLELAEKEFAELSLIQRIDLWCFKHSEGEVAPAFALCNSVAVMFAVLVPYRCAYPHLAVRCSLRLSQTSDERTVPTTPGCSLS